MSRLQVAVSGRGAPLVLIHGWAMHGGVFAPLVERLREHHTLHVVDLPGHGLSRDDTTAFTLDAVSAAIAELVPPAPWLGWSLGGLFALHAASRWSERVTGLMMLCASPRFVRTADWPFGVPVELFGDFATGLRADYRATLDRFVALEAFGSQDARGELRTLRAALFAGGEPAAQALVDGLHVLEGADLRPTLPMLRVPSLWLAGRRDRLVDPRAMRAAAALATDAEFAVIEHAGHAPFLTHADAVARLLLDFTHQPGCRSREGGNPATPIPLPGSAHTPGSRFRGNDGQHQAPHE